jgi:phage antirepressor YoqD-like protein
MNALTIEPIAAALVTIAAGEARTSTETIATGLEVEHRSVIQMVRTYVIDLQRFGEVAFQMRLNPQGSPTEYAMLNERQASLLLTFAKNTETARAFKVRLVEVFYRMAEKLRAPALPATYEQALETLLTQVRRTTALTAEVEQKTQALAVAAPKVSLYNRVLAYGETCSVDEAAKLLGFPPVKFRMFLRSYRWLYRNGNRQTPMQDKINSGYMYSKLSDYGVTPRFTPSGVEAVAAHIERMKVKAPDRYQILFG